VGLGLWGLLLARCVGWGLNFEMQAGQARNLLNRTAQERAAAAQLVIAVERA